MMKTIGIIGGMSPESTANYHFHLVRIDIYLILR